MQLRQYQIESINQLRDGFKSHVRQILCLPTGAGKTVVFSFIVSATAKKGKRCLVLTDRLELFSQTFSAINNHHLPVCKIDANNKFITYTEANVFLAMVETFKRRIKNFENIKFDLIICDEIHKSVFFKIFDAYPKTPVIGCSATPLNKNLFKYYTNIISPIDIPELIELKFLSKCKAFQMQDNFDDLKTDSSGEFTDKSLFKHFNKSSLYEGVVEKYIEKCNGKKAICFNVNIEHSEQMTKMFNGAGIKSFSITSNTPKEERDFILKEFKNGSFPVLNNASILTTGVDIPSIDVVIMNRATKSLTLFLQCAGRGSRIFPGKDYFLLLDFGMNHDRFGLWSQPREWSLDPPKKRKNAIGIAPIKSCKSCGALLPAQVTKCEYCGFIFPVNKKELKKGELVEVTEKIPSTLKGRRIGELSTDELIELEKTKLYTPQMIWRVIRSRGEDSIHEYAGKKGFNRGWSERQIMDIDKSKFNNFIIKEVVK